MDKVLFGGDGALVEGAIVTGRNAVQVDRPMDCHSGIDTSLLKQVGFCMNVWDTTPCSDNECQDAMTKISGGLDLRRVSKHLVCGNMTATAASQVVLVAATNNNTVKDNPTNRLIIALAVNPHQHVGFDNRDDD